MADSADAGLKGVAGYGRLWWASSVSDFGTYVTALAIQVLIVVDLKGSAADVGLVSGARWLPYMLFGLVIGVLVDRTRRRPLMIGADLIRGALLLAIPALALSHRLSILALAGFMTVFGLASLVGDAAHQAFVPSLVPQRLLTRAHARLDQSDAVAQTAGPALAGGIIALVGAPLAVVVDAVSYLFSALMLAGVRAAEPVVARAPGRRLRREVVEGLAFVYRHPTLAPQAVSTHAWFICSGVSGAVLAPFVLRTAQLPPSALGIALSMAGVGGLGGALLASRLGDQVGQGRAVIATRVVNAAAFVVMALTPVASTAGGWVSLAVLGAGQLLLGLSMGASNANEMGYRQSVTPDRLQGRMNATMRSINRAMVVVAAPLGGALADQIGYRTTLWAVAAGFAAGALALSITPFAEARIDTTLAPMHPARDEEEARP
jgi:MFS family permease